jgi:C4-dicarboxylate-specific signal transduction histidine kinase
MRDALFMGRLTAQATHEMQNILATIRESAGLMEDLLALGGEGFPHAERFKRGLRVLSEQVERGMTLSEQLNYCAHAPEESPAGAEVNDALRAVAGLYQRIAARFRVGLGLCTGRAGLRTGLRAVEVMNLVGLALDCALPLLPRDAVLTLSVGEQGGLAVALLDAPDYAAICAQPEYAALAALAKSLGVGLSPGALGRGLTLALPGAKA